LGLPLRGQTCGAHGALSLKRECVAMLSREGEATPCFIPEFLMEKPLCKLM
jgi:hypothetical protein